VQVCSSKTWQILTQLWYYSLYKDGIDKRSYKGHSFWIVKSFIGKYLSFFKLNISQQKDTINGSLSCLKGIASWGNNQSTVYLFFFSGAGNFRVFCSFSENREKYPAAKINLHVKENCEIKLQRNHTILNSKKVLNLIICWYFIPFLLNEVVCLENHMSCQF